MFGKIKKGIDYFFVGRRLINNKYYNEGKRISLIEQNKAPSRTDVINYLISVLNRETIYLEIGVRNPDHNFSYIKANKKYGVDPGVEFVINPVEFKMTSDDFFNQLKRGEILKKEIKFDVIFIDGLHIADQVDRDISNSLQYIKDDGFVVLHDCNPPTEWHSREQYSYPFTPAEGNWNGTTWKAFVKWSSNPKLNSCCIDSDWGVGILSKKQKLGMKPKIKNPFFEFSIFHSNRVESLNLISFEKLKKLLNK